MLFFWNFFFKFFNEARRFGSRLCFGLQARKALNPVDCLDRAILTHWGPINYLLFYGFYL